MKEKRSEGNRLKKRNTLYWMPSKIINGQGSSTMKARMIEFIMMIRAVTEITERKRVEEELMAASDDMVLRANNLPWRKS